jgi:predicted site-specific integrase-resolvase
MREQQSEFLRPKFAAQYLNVGLSTVWLYIKQGKLTPIKLSSKVTVISRQELANFAGDVI